MADEFILYSGGAIGADSFFGINAEQYGITEQHYSFRGHTPCRSRGRVILEHAQLQLGNSDLLTVIGMAFKNHQSAIDATATYWQRNWYQVQRTGEVFVVTKNISGLMDFTLPETEGAGIGVALAMKTKEACKRVCVYDQVLKSWYVWERNPDSFTSGINIEYKKIDVDTQESKIEQIHFAEMSDIKISATEFTGIGTRELNSRSIKAIAKLFERSFASRTLSA